MARAGDFDYRFDSWIGHSSESPVTPSPTGKTESAATAARSEISRRYEIPSMSGTRFAALQSFFEEPNGSNRSLISFNADEPSATPAALLALETDRNEWDGMWTYRRPLVERLDAYIRENL